MFMSLNKTELFFLYILSISYYMSHTSLVYQYDTQQIKHTYILFLCKVTKLDLVTIVAYVGLYKENINVPCNAKKSEMYWL